MPANTDFERFNLRHLRYFLAVCESGSFRAASAKLNIAQSAVSRRVGDLERIFAVTLFERRPRGVALTDAGAVLRSGALKIHEEIEAALATLDRYGRGEQGTLAVGFLGTTIRLGFVPQIIARFRAERPHFKLDLHPMPRTTPADPALAGLDVAFVEGAEGPATGRNLLRIYSGAYVVALPRRHPLTALTAIPSEELGRHDLIAIPQAANPQVYGAMLGFAARDGNALTIVHESDSECSRLALAAAGMGLTFVSPLAINHQQEFDVEYRPIADAEIPFDLWLSVKPGATAIAESFVEIARNLLLQLPSLSA